MKNSLPLEANDRTTQLESQNLLLLEPLIIHIFRSHPQLRACDILRSCSCIGTVFYIVHGASEEEKKIQYFPSCLLKI